MPQWDSDVYLKFAAERTQPSIDLMQRIKLENPLRIIDLGCGPGNSTEVLRQRWPKAVLLGLDSSAEMIKKAKQDYPTAQWEIGDASSDTWAKGRTFDLIFSNAMLQWLPDHAKACNDIFQHVAVGGALAIQIPSHSHVSAHKEILAVAKDPIWRRLNSVPQGFITQPIQFYYDVLQARATYIDLWETTYYHVVNGPEAIVEWFRGTGMRPYLQALVSAAERQQFEAMLLEQYKLSYLPQANGKVLFPFRRLFFVAYK